MIGTCAEPALSAGLVVGVDRMPAAAALLPRVLVIPVGTALCIEVETTAGLQAQSRLPWFG